MQLFVHLLTLVPACASSVFRILFFLLSKNAMARAQIRENTQKPPAENITRRHDKILFFLLSMNEFQLEMNLVENAIIFFSWTIPVKFKEHARSWLSEQVPLLVTLLTYEQSHPQSRMSCKTIGHGIIQWLHHIHVHCTTLEYSNKSWNISFVLFNDTGSQ